MEIKWNESRFFSPVKIGNQMIIIHHTGSTNGQINSLQGTLDWFKPDPWRDNFKVSAQYIIPRYEEYIVQMVQDEHTAYHAGSSEWVINGQSYEYLNNRSIGIELQGDGNLIEYTPWQYEALIWLVREKMEKFDIPAELVQGHEHISPGRKVDPGRLFDWKKLREELIPKVQVVVPEPGETKTVGIYDIEFYEENDDVCIGAGDSEPNNEGLASLFGLY